MCFNYFNNEIQQRKNAKRGLNYIIRVYKSSEKIILVRVLLMRIKYDNQI